MSLKTEEISNFSWQLNWGLITTYICGSFILHFSDYLSQIWVTESNTEQVNVSQFQLNKHLQIDVSTLFCWLNTNFYHNMSVVKYWWVFEMGSVSKIDQNFIIGNCKLGHLRFHQDPKNTKFKVYHLNNVVFFITSHNSTCLFT